MAKISLTKVSSEELDRLLGVSLDTENDGDTTNTEIVSATNNSTNDDVSATNISEETNRSDTTADVSATNNSRGQYINQYKKDHYDVLRISLPKGVKAVLQQEAKERNVSVTNMVLQALTQYLDKDVSSTNT